MRLVLDTNVLFAAYIARGTCAALYEQILATETLITSEPILSEFEQALLLKARVPHAEAAAARRQAQGNAEVFQPSFYRHPFAGTPMTTRFSGPPLRPRLI